MGLGVETGALECRGLLVDGWGILYPLGAVKGSARTALASAAVWILGFGRLWLALSSLSIVWCKQHFDAVGCQFLALFASFSAEVLHSCSARRAASSGLLNVYICLWLSLPEVTFGRTACSLAQLQLAMHKPG